MRKLTTNLNYCQFPFKKKSQFFDNAKGKVRNSSSARQLLRFGDTTTNGDYKKKVGRMCRNITRLFQMLKTMELENNEDAISSRIFGLRNF